MLKNEVKARQFVPQIEETVENELEQKQTVLATKEDLATSEGRLRSEIKGIKSGYGQMAGKYFYSYCFDDFWALFQEILIGYLESILNQKHLCLP